MNTKTAGYLILYGLFLVVTGLLGYLSNPEKARTALIMGGAFGGTSALLGILGARGSRWASPVAMATTALLALACAWRAVVSWTAVAQGASDKAFAAAIISAMLVASLLMLAALRKKGPAPG